MFNEKESAIISEELSKLKHKGVVKEIPKSEVKYVSTIFLRPKKDGSYRLILNLKKLNENVEKYHFKMETLKAALNLVTPNCYFPSIDLKDAYYSVPVSTGSQGWLSFYWDGVYHTFTSLPNGLSTAPRVYTKIMKPVFSSLRKLGHSNVTYIDDSLLKSDDIPSCKDNILETVKLVDHLGFTVHPDKSVLDPTQEIVFVGFIINSVTMTVKLTPEKVQDIVYICTDLLRRDRIVIHDLAKLVGKMVASELGVQYTPLFYKPLEIDKDEALRESKGNFSALMTLSEESKKSVKWWIDNLQSSFKPILASPPGITIESDSSKLGWGAINKTSCKTVQGLWSSDETDIHINILEMKAAFLALQHFFYHLQNIHVRLFLDNTVAIKYLNKMGGRKKCLNNLTKDIWLWCMERNIWLSVFHIPGRENTVADKLSRNMNSDMEWTLSDSVFQQIQSVYQPSTVDLFASKYNSKLPQYVSFTPDPNALAVNAFSLTWTDINSYLFPPFSLLGMVLQKVQLDQSTATLVAPIFHTQPWFPSLLEMTCNQPYLLPKPISCLTMLQHLKQQQHPLKKMRLGVFRISGKSSLVKAFHDTLPISSFLHGDKVQKRNMGRLSKSGFCFVTGKKLINLIPIL